MIQLGFVLLSVIFGAFFIALLDRTVSSTVKRQEMCCTGQLQTLGHWGVEDTAPVCGVVTLPSELLERPIATHVCRVAVVISRWA